MSQDAALGQSGQFFWKHKNKGKYACSPTMPDGLVGRRAAFILKKGLRSSSDMGAFRHDRRFIKRPRWPAGDFQLASDIIPTSNTIASISSGSIVSGTHHVACSTSRAEYATVWILFLNQSKFFGGKEESPRSANWRSACWVLISHTFRSRYDRASIPSHS